MDGRVTGDGVDGRESGCGAVNYVGSEECGVIGVHKVTSWKEGGGEDMGKGADEVAVTESERV